MNGIQKRYGFKEDKKTEEFHKNRRMFCIRNNELIIAKPNLPYSHAEWFEKEGWITEDDESFMNEGVRGYVDNKGNIYFYTGYDFRINKEIEDIFLKNLSNLLHQLNMETVGRVYGGMRRVGQEWVPRKEYVIKI